MLKRLIPRSVRPAGVMDPDLPEVSQPFPLDDAPTSARKHIQPADPAAGVDVIELSEMEARALCAREDIAVFWTRPPWSTKGGGTIPG